jgi:hypothetical protein
MSEALQRAFIKAARYPGQRLGDEAWSMDAGSVKGGEKMCQMAV